jgi:hypothetical protein
MKRLLLAVTIILVIFCIAVIGGSFYMLDYSLSPDEERTDTAASFKQFVEKYPNLKPWLDSLKACNGLRDTFVNMPRGERHHAYLIPQADSCRIAIIVHGWRDCAIKFMYLAYLYQQMGYNVLMPDLHAHGLSEGDAIGMGWQERKDVMHWMTVAAARFKSSDFIVHGVSMGAATTMNVSGEPMPECVKTIKFIEDCGYTSVWDEFSYELDDQFGLPAFPLLYTTSLLCKIRYGWSFQEAAPIEQVKKSRYPMLFIHGDNDDFVPSRMVYPLHKAKQGHKDIWITKGVEHAKSYSDYPKEYTLTVQKFINH